MKDDGNLNVLVVEDEATILKLIIFLLKKNFYKVAVAGYEVEIFETLKKKTPAIIILSVNHKNIDAIGVIRKVRETEDTSGMPILCLSSKGSELKMMRALQEGATSYIVKPFTPKDLLDKVIASLRKEA